MDDKSGVDPCHAVTTLLLPVDHQQGDMSVRTMDEMGRRTDPQINTSTSYRVIEGGNISRVDLTCFECGLTLYRSRNGPGRLSLSGLRGWDVGLIVTI